MFNEALSFGLFVQKPRLLLSGSSSQLKLIVAWVTYSRFSRSSIQADCWRIGLSEWVETEVGQGGHSCVRRYWRECLSHKATYSIQLFSWGTSDTSVKIRGFSLLGKTCGTCQEAPQRPHLKTLLWRINSYLSHNHTRSHGLSQMWTQQYSVRLSHLGIILRVLSHFSSRALRLDWCHESVVLYQLHQIKVYSPN